jgi:hypothetical protein
MSWQELLFVAAFCSAVYFLREFVRRARYGVK